MRQLKAPPMHARNELLAGKAGRDMAPEAWFRFKQDAPFERRGAGS
jgi:hypothetical protein